MVLHIPKQSTESVLPFSAQREYVKVSGELEKVSKCSAVCIPVVEVMVDLKVLTGGVHQAVGPVLGQVIVLSIVSRLGYSYRNHRLILPFRRSCPRGHGRGTGLSSPSGNFHSCSLAFTGDC